MKTYNIAVVGDGYGRNGKALFLKDIEDLKSELFIRLHQRKSQFNFIPLSHDNNFRCKESGMFDGATCDTAKVIKAVGSTQYNSIAVAARRLTGGGGGSLTIWGTSYSDTLHSGQMGVHEGSHTWFGLQHDGGFMNQSGSDGAAGVNATFTVAQFLQINKELNKIEVFPSPTPAISGSLESFTTPTGPKSIIVKGQVTGLIQHVEIYFDGNLKTTLIYWGTPERNQECNPVNGIKYFIQNVSLGNHTVKIKVFDINLKFAETTIQINVI